MLPTRVLTIKLLNAVLNLSNKSNTKNEIILFLAFKRRKVTNSVKRGKSLHFLKEKGKFPQTCRNHDFAVQKYSIQIHNK